MNVEMRVLRTYLGEEGLVHRGETITVAPSRANILQRRGLARPVVTKPGPGPSETQHIGPKETKNPEPAPEPGVDGVEARWICNIDGCGRTFETKRGLQMHRKSAHPELQDEPEGLSG